MSVRSSSARTAGVLLALVLGGCGADGAGPSEPPCCCGPPELVIQNADNQEVRELRLHSGGSYRDAPDALGGRTLSSGGELRTDLHADCWYVTVFRPRLRTGSADLQAPSEALTTARPVCLEAGRYTLIINDQEFWLSRSSTVDCPVASESLALGESGGCGSGSGTSTEQASPRLDAYTGPLDVFADTEVGDATGGSCPMDGSPDGQADTLGSDGDAGDGSGPSDDASGDALAPDVGAEDSGAEAGGTDALDASAALPSDLGGTGAFRIPSLRGGGDAAGGDAQGDAPGTSDGGTGGDGSDAADADPQVDATDAGSDGDAAASDGGAEDGGPRCSPGTVTDPGGFGGAFGGGLDEAGSFKGCRLGPGPGGRGQIVLLGSLVLLGLLRRRRAG